MKTSLKGSLSVILFLLLQVSLLHSQSFQADSWAEVQENKAGSITVLYIEEDAFAYTDESGKLVGITIEILEQFKNYIENTKKVRLNIDYIAADDFVKFYNDVKDAKGGVFGLGNVTITDDRAKEIAFSPPYMTNIAMLITHSSVPDLDKVPNMASAFDGFTALLYRGTTHETRMLDLKKRYYPAMKTIGVDSDATVIERISNDDKLMAYTDLSVFWLATQQGKPIKRHEVADDVSENFGIIMPKDSDWVPLINDFFNLGSGYRANPAYRKILMSHLGGEVTKMLEMAYKKSQQ